MHNSLKVTFHLNLAHLNFSSGLIDSELPALTPNTHSKPLPATPCTGTVYAVPGHLSTVFMLLVCISVCFPPQLYHLVRHFRTALYSPGEAAIPLMSRYIPACP